MWQNAMGYINNVRARAGAKALTGTATVRTVLMVREDVSFVANIVDFMI